VALAVWLVVVYNGFIKLVNRTKEAWSDIDVQLKRRYDLVDNLVETVKGYAKHEKGVFEKVTEARTAAMTAEAKGNPKDVENAENMLAGAIKTLFAVSENYPELKASSNFLQLQSTLADIENNIQSSRRYYNGSVRDLNIKIDSFPYNVIAGLFKFKKWDYFGVENEPEKEPVKVDFK